MAVSLTRHRNVTRLSRNVPMIVVDAAALDTFKAPRRWPRGERQLRYGLVRHIEGHPPAAVQRRLAEQAGCELVLEEGPPTRASLKAQWKLLFDLKRGDELLVSSLDTLQMSTGELVLLLRKFDQTGVTLRIVGGDTVFTVSFSGAAGPLLALLAAHEKLHPALQRPRPRSRPRGKPLSRYQIDYALELRRHGASLRTIGLLFQISPDELLQVINEGGGGATAAPNRRADILSRPAFGARSKSARR